MIPNDRRVYGSICAWWRNRSPTLQLQQHHVASNMVDLRLRSNIIKPQMIIIGIHSKHGALNIKDNASTKSGARIIYLQNSLVPVVFWNSKPTTLMAQKKNAKRQLSWLLKRPMVCYWQSFSVKNGHGMLVTIPHFQTPKVKMSLLISATFFQSYMHMTMYIHIYIYTSTYIIYIHTHIDPTNYKIVYRLWEGPTI